MTTMEILRTTRLCPLNENGQCMVYEDRPVVCRSAHSYNVRVCRAYTEKGEILPSKTNALVMEIGRFVAAASGAINEHFGIDDRSFELVDAVDLLLRDDAANLDQVHRPDVEAAALQDMRRLRSGFAS